MSDEQKLAEWRKIFAAIDVLECARSDLAIENQTRSASRRTNDVVAERHFRARLILERLILAAMNPESPSK